MLACDLVLLVMKMCCKVDSEQRSISRGSREKQKAGQGKRVHAEKSRSFILVFWCGNQWGAEHREQKKSFCKDGSQGGNLSSEGGM